jgi:hypothetical protein
MGWQGVSLQPLVMRRVGWLQALHPEGGRHQAHGQAQLAQGNAQANLLGRHAQRAFSLQLHMAFDQVSSNVTARFSSKILVSS